MEIIAYVSVVNFITVAAGVSCFKPLSRLRSLNLGYNLLSEIYQNDVGSLETLEELKMNDNQIKNVFFKNIFYYQSHSTASNIGEVMTSGYCAWNAANLFLFFKNDLQCTLYKDGLFWSEVKTASRGLQNETQIVENLKIAFSKRFHI